jgi:hypothetical protein
MSRRDNSIKTGSGFLVPRGWRKCRMENMLVRMEFLSGMMELFWN